jgi:hypothetical protein
VHGLRCMHSFEYGLSNATPLHKLKDDRICLFYHEVMHLLEVLGEQ